MTNEILAQAPELTNCEVGGLLHLFIQHTSASLAINENADPDVRGDLERHFNVMVPEHADYYEHTLEGPDDTTSHIKSVIIGPSLTIPISHGHLALGTWQASTFANTGTKPVAVKLWRLCRGGVGEL